VILKDKVVIVTGAGPGMGSKLCALIAEEGAKIVLAARTKDYVEELADNIKKAGGQALAVQADVSVRADCDRLAAAAVERFGAINGLVNSAYPSRRIPPVRRGRSRRLEGQHRRNAVRCLEYDSGGAADHEKNRRFDRQCRHHGNP
jgi:NAD(P)-dependent dehydrogenase (short-subunit alcohol dehydrogenase family)